MKISTCVTTNARSCRLATLFAGACVASLLWGEGAVAQNASTTAQDSPTTGKGDVAEVVVTSQRRAEKVQTVPISVTAITSDTITKDRVEGIAEYLAMTPNVSFVDNGSRDRVDISIRGISNQLDPYGDVRPSSFAFYIDDFNVAALTTNPQVVDLDRIEILRGPQGTYFGRNAEGGAINISTHAPTDTFGAQVGLDYSSFNTFKAEGVVNIPLAPGLLDVRLSGQSETSNGNIKNINPIGGGNNSDYKTGRMVVRFTPTSHFTWDNTLDYSDETVGMRDGVPTGALTATWRAVYYHNAAGNVADPNGVGFFPSNDDEVNFNTPQSIGTKYYYGSSRAVYDFEKMALTVVGGYGESQVFNHGDVDGSSYDYFNENDILRRQSSSIEARLASTDKGFLEWTVGANAGYDIGKTDQSTTYGSQAINLGFNHPDGFEITGLHSRETDEYQGVFGQAIWHALPQWDLVVGGRYTHESVGGRFVNLSNEVVTNNEANRAASFNDFSPAVTLKYKPITNTIIYATASKGFKTGGVQASTTLLQNSYLPETLWNYEGGVKYDMFDHRLRLDLAVFYEKWKNVQQSVRFQYLSATGSLLAVTGIANAASAHSEGFDGSADFKVDQHITLNGHIGYDQANYDSYKNALIDGVVIDASGKPLVDAPKWTAGATGEYRHNLWDGYDGFGQLQWDFRSKTLSSTYALRYNYYPFIAPSFSNVDLRLGIEHANYSVIFYVENLLNAKYFTNSYEKAFYSGVQVVPSYQRIGVSFNYKM